MNRDAFNQLERDAIQSTPDPRTLKCRVRPRGLLQTKNQSLTKSEVVTVRFDWDVIADRSFLKVEDCEVDHIELT